MDTNVREGVTLDSTVEIVTPGSTAQLLQDPKYQTLKSEAVEHTRRTALWGAGSIAGALSTAGAITLGLATATTPLLMGAAVLAGATSAVFTAISGTKAVKSGIDTIAADQNVRNYINKAGGKTELASQEEIQQAKLLLVPASKQPEKEHPLEPTPVPQTEFQQVNLLPISTAKQAERKEPVQVRLIPEKDTDPLVTLLADAHREIIQNNPQAAYYDTVLSAQKGTVLLEINDKLQPQQAIELALNNAKSK